AVGRRRWRLPLARRLPARPMGTAPGPPPNCPLAESPVFKRAASIARSQNTSTAAAHCPEHRSPSGPHSDDTYCGPPPAPHPDPGVHEGFSPSRLVLFPTD
ncbi:hypothetical protein IscW_ISCW000350, partial [Ixodes scapularis]